MGAWVLVPLSYAVTVVQPGFVNRGPKRGSEATKRGGGGGEEGVGGGFHPSHGKEIFENSGMKTAFFVHIKCHFLGIDYIYEV